MKADCEKIHSLLPAAAEGELDEAARAEVLEHAQECRDCADALDFQTRLHAAVTGDPEPSPPPLYFESVLEEIHRRMPVRPSAGPRARRPIFHPPAVATALAAALALVWISAGLTFLPGGEGFKPGVPVARFARSAADWGSREVSFVLVNGYGLLASDSQVWSYPPELRREIGLPEALTHPISIVASLAKG
jgi:hypothetical protein